MTCTSVHAEYLLPGYPELILEGCLDKIGFVAFICFGGTTRTTISWISKSKKSLLT